MEIVFYALSFAAIAVMAYGVLRVMTLRKKVKGGVVGSTWNILTGLILMFMAGYLATPFFPMLPQTFKDLLVGVIFFFGAVFVVIVIKLFHRIVSDSWALARGERSGLHCAAAQADGPGGPRRARPVARFRKWSTSSST